MRTPTDPYNIAHKYLCDTYGCVKWMANEKTRRKEIEDGITDDDYIHVPKEPTDDTGKLIQLLMSQYHYGQAPKNELKQLLITMKLMSN